MLILNSNQYYNHYIGLRREGAHIITDTNMALSGISKKRLEAYGVKVSCFMSLLLRALRDRILVSYVRNILATWRGFPRA